MFKTNNTLARDIKSNKCSTNTNPKAGVYNLNCGSCRKTNNIWKESYTQIKIA